MPFIASCSFSFSAQSPVPKSNPEGFIFPGRCEGLCPGKTLRAWGRSWEGRTACVGGLAGEDFKSIQTSSCSFSCSLRDGTESWEGPGCWGVRGSANPAKPLASWGCAAQRCWGYSRWLAGPPLDCLTSFWTPVLLLTSWAGYLTSWSIRCLICGTW